MGRPPVHPVATFQIQSRRAWPALPSVRLVRDNPTSGANDRPDPPAGRTVTTRHARVMAGIPGWQRPHHATLHPTVDPSADPARNVSRTLRPAAEAMSAF